jgi:hypothetical protein
MRKPIIVLVLGILMFLISLTADSTGIGEGTGLGWKQITGAVFGLLMAAAAMVQLRRPPES